MSFRTTQEESYEEGLRAVLDDPDEAGAGRTLDGVPASASSAFVPQCWNWQTGAICNRVPIPGIPGPIPGWGITPSKNRDDNTIVCRK